MSDENIEVIRVRDKVVQCKCGTILHVERKTFCCGIDWLRRYYSVYPLPSESFVPTKKKLKSIEKEVVKKVRKRRRKRKAIPIDIKEKVLKRDGYKCVECGSTMYLHIHHIWECQFGGGNDIGNLTTVCEKCHAKHHKHEHVYNIMMKRIKDHKKKFC